MTRSPQAPETEPFLRKPSLSNSKLEDTWECVSVFFRSQLAVLLQSLWVSVDFSMKTPSSGFPTKAMFLRSYESSIVCQNFGEQTMAGADEGKNGGFIVLLKRESKACKLPPSDFLSEHFPSIHPQSWQKNPINRVTFRSHQRSYQALLRKSQAVA